jgi:glycosyltransferase involved in cell wall biosynthesis
MNILFVHQNFPGQFKHLAPELVRRGHTVVALALRAYNTHVWQGVSLVSYSVERRSSANIHPWLADFESKTIRGEACFRAAHRLQSEGFTPDVIIAHPAWGDSLFLKHIWPLTRLGTYGEYYYKLAGGDMNFDPEFGLRNDITEPCRLSLKNLNNHLHFNLSDAWISPTHWQASTFPENFQAKMQVIHDGIHTNIAKPNLLATYQPLQNRPFTRNDEIITFINRNLEPYRGYHIFMRALPELLKSRPNAHILIVGGNGVSYGSKPKAGKSWKDIFIDEVRPKISDADWVRVHFLGNIPYQDYLSLLQVSTVHVYLTYPFVLSWSLLEAMSIGCAIVASNTQPLHEVIQHNVTGRLVDFFDVAALTTEVINLLDQPDRREHLGRAARTFAKKHYDLETICLPQQVQWVERLATL